MVVSVEQRTSRQREILDFYRAEPQQWMRSMVQSFETTVFELSATVSMEWKKCLILNNFFCDLFSEIRIFVEIFLIKKKKMTKTVRVKYEFLKASDY